MSKLESYEWFRALEKAESEGKIAYSNEVRLSLMASVRAGEMTLEESQAKLKKIQRDAKKNGKLTRNQLHRELS